MTPRHRVPPRAGLGPAATCRTAARSAPPVARRSGRRTCTAPWHDASRGMPGSSCACPRRADAVSRSTAVQWRSCWLSCQGGPIPPLSVKVEPGLGQEAIEQASAVLHPPEAGLHQGGQLVDVLLDQVGQRPLEMGSYGLMFPALRVHDPELHNPCCVRVSDPRSREGTPVPNGPWFPRPDARC
jgi:hypothetical protein